MGSNEDRGGNDDGYNYGVGQEKPHLNFTELQRAEISIAVCVCMYLYSLEVV